jgi:hypothetical protein
MSPPRFTVVPGGTFHDQLASLWLADRSVTRAMNRLEEVLQILPDQAGTPFEHRGQTFWFIRHEGFQVTYQILSDDCLVSLHDIRPLK